MSETSQITILHGSDEYAIAAHIDKLCAGLGDSSSADMNIARFDGRTGLDYEALNSAINATPFLSPRRVVVLMHPGATLSTPQNRSKILDLLDKAQPTTTIILVEEELKEGNWLVKWAAHAGSRVVIHNYDLPKRWEMPRWIESETKKQKGKIETQAAVRLSEMVGEDTRIAAQELTKLLTYVNFERPINLLDVERVSIVSAQGSVFDLVDAIGLRDGRKAQHAFHQLLEDEDASEFWGMIIRQFRLLIQARELLDENASVREIQKNLGVHDFVAQKVTAQAKRFSLPVLEAIYHKLLEIDEGVKTSQITLDVALDTLIVELTRKA
jgi:DNA polymerase III subunit delta